MNELTSTKFEHITKETIQNEFDAMAPTYNRKLWVDENVLGTKRLRKQLMQLATGDVLDVACGTGLNFPWFGQIDSLSAVDLSSEMIAIASSAAAEAGIAVDLHVMDAESLTFADNSFDTVVSALSTCTFPDPIAALREMNRVCKPTGQILLVEHGRSSLRPLAHYQDRNAHAHYEKSAGCRWNQEPDQLVMAAGLRIRKSRRATFDVFHAIQAVPTK